MQGVVFLALLLLASGARGQELTPEWFKAQYLPAIAKVEQAYDTTSARVTETTTNSANDDRAVTKINFAIDDLQHKFDRTISETQGGHESSWTRSIIASPEVSFMVITKQDASEPLLEHVNRSELGYRMARSRIKNQACESVFCAFSVLGRTVASWIRDKEFKFNSITRRDDKVRIEFFCKDDPKADREYVGWIDFLPDRQWVIDGWEITISAPQAKFSWRDVSKNSYSSFDPVPILKGVTLVEHNPDVVVTRKLTVDELAFAPIADDAFRLSSYGYSDRIGMPARMIDSIWFWAAVVGAICLLAAGAIRYRLKAA